MKKILQFIAVYGFITVFGQQYSNSTAQRFLDEGGIICEYAKFEKVPILEMNAWFQYTAEGEILKIQAGTSEVFPSKLDRTYTEQGLLIKEYIPVNFLSSQAKRIYRFCYDEESMEPVVVVEIVYSSTTKYTIIKYFTRKWAELTNYKN